jgi:hypothetical protein
MKMLVFSGFESTRSIVNRALRGADEETISSMGNFENLYRTIRNIKAYFRNPNPYTFEDLRLSHRLSTTCLNMPLYRYDPEIMVV